MTDELNDFLEHYGVKGMKWGVRKSRKQRRLEARRRRVEEKSTKKKINISDDAKAVANLRSKNVSELSNAELKLLAERLNLETKLNNVNQSHINRGHSRLKKAVAVGVTVEQAHRLATGPVGKATTRTGYMILKKASPYTAKKVYKAAKKYS